MADRTIEIVIKGKNMSGDEFKQVQADLGEVGHVAEKTSAAIQYAFGQIAFDTIMKVSDAAGALFKNMVGEATEADKVMAQLESVLRSTGGAAGITKDAALDLAGSLAKLTLFEDDAILAAENLLLTFTSIGKKVFPEATAVILDMSQALGQDLQSSAMQLGKALNDPIAGITSLRRVGVQFTDAQEDMIKGLVKSGQTMEAQRLILEELRKEFGGSAVAAADTFGGALVQLDKAWKDLLETVGSALTQNETYKNLIQAVTNAINSLAESFTNLPAGVQVAVITVIGLVAALGKLAPALIAAKVLFGGVSLGGISLAGTLTKVGGAAAGAGGLLAKFGALLAGLGGMLSGLASTIGSALAGPLAAFGAFLLGSTAPVLLLIGAIAGLVVAIALFGREAANTFDMIMKIIMVTTRQWQIGFHKMLRSTMDTAAQLVTIALTWFSNVGRAIVEGIWHGIEASWWQLKVDVRALLDDLVNYFKESLSIGSPSLVFANQIGAPMAQGIAQGFGQTMTRMAAPAMAAAVSPAAVMGTTNRYQVGHIEIHNPLSQSERGWINRRAESISARTVERLLK